MPAPAKKTTSPVVDSSSRQATEDDYENLILSLDFQTSRCQSTRYHTESFPRCTACIRRQAGDGCRFQDIRAFLRDYKGELVAFAFPGHRKPEAPSLDFPSQWNVPLLNEHVKQIKVFICVALSLYI
jgi:lysine-specific demethylase 3